MLDEHSVGMLGWLCGDVFNHLQEIHTRRVLKGFPPLQFLIPWVKFPEF